MTKKFYTILECQTDDLQHVCQRVLKNFWDLNKAHEFYENLVLAYRDMPDYRVIENSAIEMEIYHELSKVNRKIQLIEMEVE